VGSKNTDLEYFSMFKHKTGAQKLMMGFSMFNFASQFLISSILSKLKTDNLNNLKVIKEILLRMYGDQLSPQQIKGILAEIRYRNGN